MIPRPLARQTPFFEKLYAEIEKLGGMHNAHIHLDRAGTLEERYQQALPDSPTNLSFMSLQEKHKRIHDVHAGPAYEAEDLIARARFYLDVMIEAGSYRVDSMVDVCNDKAGLNALETLQQVLREYADRIDLRLAAYSPLGNKKNDNDSWALLETGAEKADFIGLLPEADDVDDYPDHIGFYEHCRRGLLLGQRLNKMVHVHTDQRVLPGEDGTEVLVKAVREFGAPKLESGEPAIWAVHAISPTTYSEDRFVKLAHDLSELNIGIISCPSAALGMRQIRSKLTPTDNSIPRVLDLLHMGVKVRIGSDNIADICSPSTTADLMDEIMFLAAALRFYNPGILAKLAAGYELDANEVDFLGEHLKKNRTEASKFKRFF